MDDPRGNRGWLVVWWALVLAAALLWVYASVAHGQEGPPPPSDGGGGGIDLGPITGALDGLGDAFQDAIDGAVEGLQNYLFRMSPLFAVQAALTVLGGIASWFLTGGSGGGSGSTDVLGAFAWITRTPPALLFDQMGATTRVRQVQAAALVLLVPAVAFNGTAVSMGALREDMDDTVRRIVTGAVLVVTCDTWLRVLVAAFDELAGALAGRVALPGMDRATALLEAMRTLAMGSVTAPDPEATRVATETASSLLGAGAALVAYAVFGACAAFAAMGRLGVLQAMISLAPLACVMLVAPLGQGLFFGWGRSLITLLGVQLVVNLLAGTMGLLVQDGASSGDVMQLGAGIVVGVMAVLIYTTGAVVGARQMFSGVRLAVRASRAAAGSP